MNMTLNEIVQYVKDAKKAAENSRQVAEERLIPIALFAEVVGKTTSTIKRYIRSGKFEDCYVKSSNAGQWGRIYIDRKKFQQRMDEIKFS